MSSQRRPGHPPGELRIIGGRWRGRRLPILATSSLRPTPDRVRETLFNWLSPWIEGAGCLDLCAGSGALGFEAVSRDAAGATLVEQDAALCRNLRRQACRLQAEEQLRIVEAGAQEWLRNCQHRFDVVFLDPPYAQADLWYDCCRLLTGEPALLQPGGLLYLEQPALPGDRALPGLHILKQGRAGRVHFCLFQYRP